MSLVGLRQAVVDSIAASFGPDGTTPVFRAVQTHGGKFNSDELKRLASKAPAALVALMGGPITREGGTQAVGKTALVVFILTRGDSETKRDADALVLSEAVVGLMVKNDWDYADAQAPMEMAMANLYSGVIDRIGMALWSVGWSQANDLAIVDTSDLPLFHHGNVKWDLADMDGVVDMEDDIWVNGEFMSAYGQIYVSTAAPTSIAAIDTYQKAMGTTTLKTTPAAVDFDMPATNRLRHIGTVVKPILVGASGSLTVSADAKVTLAVVDETTEQEIECTLAEGAEPFSLRGLFNLNANEYTEVWVKADATVNVTLTKLSMVAAAT
jgi:hypothetical protein